MDNLTLPSAAVLGFAGYALWETHRQYQMCVPSMMELRDTPSGDIRARQALLDGDVTVGTIVGLSAVLAGAVTKDWRTPLLMIAGFLVISGLHHMVLHEPTVGRVWGE